jgi:hypothetical protein
MKIVAWQIVLGGSAVGGMINKRGIDGLDGRWVDRGKR